MDRLVPPELCLKYTRTFKHIPKTLGVNFSDPVPQLTRTLPPSFSPAAAHTPSVTAGSCRVAAPPCCVQRGHGPMLQQRLQHDHPVQPWVTEGTREKREPEEVLQEEAVKGCQRTCFQVTETDINAHSWKPGHQVTSTKLKFQLSLQWTALLCCCVLVLIRSYKKQASKFLVICLNIGFRVSIYLCHCEHLA